MGVLGSSWAPWGSSGASLGSSWAALGSSWPLLDLSWIVLGASWAYSGSSWCSSDPLLALLERLLAPGCIRDGISNRFLYHWDADFDHEYGNSSGLSIAHVWVD